MFLYQELKKRAESNSPIKVGLIGAGKFGSMFLSQVPTTSGLEVVAIADLNPKQAKQNCNNIGWDKDRVNSTVFFEDVSSMIKECEIEIGGQRIDKHYSEWLDIWGELNKRCG